MVNALSFVKLAVSAVVGVGTNEIVKGIIKNNVDVPTRIDKKVAVVTATWVISGLVTTATRSSTDETIDKAAKFAGGIINQFKIASKLGKINRKESTFEQEGLDINDFVQDPKTKNWAPIKKKDDENVDAVTENVIAPVE